jgi:hypothetical protein
MATFTPPTYFVPWTKLTDQGDPKQRLFRFYDGVPAAYSVIITGGAASDAPGQIGPTTEEILAADAGSGDEGRAVFQGGRSYTITGTEETILTAAGYGAYIV